jgi:hypothetical protein
MLTLCSWDKVDFQEPGEGAFSPIGGISTPESHHLSSGGAMWVSGITENGYSQEVMVLEPRSAVVRTNKGVVQCF